MIELTCECCGFMQVFDDAEAAFRAGWDAPPHFHGYVACDLCPASFIVLGQKLRHVSVHDRWAREGRPAEHSQETCLAPEDRVAQADIDALTRIIDNLDPQTKEAIKRAASQPPPS